MSGFIGMMVQIMSKTKTYKVRGYAECILTTEILASSREEEIGRASCRERV